MNESHALLQKTLGCHIPMNLSELSRFLHMEDQEPLVEMGKGDNLPKVNLQRQLKRDIVGN